eukprot:TRINITY_DN14671_c0_g1_i2.p1 TRINITY_DN14671_c0_g1~~TRINITY_DN14671_c0_g1_i2.p1  ORF type:complete len:591 (-),score=167.74 TRINITY_DN14671_c0_g1_i2:80-1852(-)
MSAWECVKCQMDNDASAEICEWCETTRDRGDAARLSALPDDGDLPQRTPEEAEEAAAKLWQAERRHDLLQELQAIDALRDDERHRRLRALQLELHPDKHPRRQQQAQALFLLVQERWEESDTARRRRRHAERAAATAARQEAELKKRQEAEEAQAERFRRQEAAKREAEAQRQEQKRCHARGTLSQEDREKLRRQVRGAQNVEMLDVSEDEREVITPEAVEKEQLCVEEARRQREDKIREEQSATDQNTVPSIWINVSDVQHQEVCQLIGKRNWIVADVKDLVEGSEGLPPSRQRLLLRGGEQEVEDTDFLGALSSDENLNLTLVICSEKQYEIQEFLKSIHTTWRVLQFAAPAIRANRLVVRLCMRKNPRALQFASPELRKDRKLVKTALKRDGSALEILTAFQDDRLMVLTAVQQTWRALPLASLRLRGDPEIVGVALSHDLEALRHATPELLADREFMLVAVRVDGLALQHGSEALRGDRDLVLAAAKQNPKAMVYIAPQLRLDPVLQAAFKGNVEILKHMQFDTEQRVQTEQSMFDENNAFTPLFTYEQIMSKLQQTQSARGYRSQQPKTRAQAEASRRPDAEDIA